METAAAIEAVGAETVLGESDGFYKNLYRIKLQRGEPEPLTYLLYESVVFRRTGCCVLIEILVGIPLQVADDAASQQFHVALR